MSCCTLMGCSVPTNLDLNGLGLTFQWLEAARGWYSSFLHRKVFPCFPGKQLFPSGLLPVLERKL